MQCHCRDADSGSEWGGRGEGTQLAPWECAPGLLSLACLHVEHLSAGHADALARHTATLTALTALTWLAHGASPSGMRPRPTGQSSALPPAAADTAADTRRAARAEDTVHAATDPGAVGALAAALWELSRMRALTLEASDSTTAAAAVLAAALRSSTMLTRVSLRLRSFKAFSGRGSGAGGNPFHGFAGGACAPLRALTNLQHVSLEASGGAPLWPRQGGSHGAGGWEALPRSVNEIVADLVAAPQLTFLCLRETGCTRDAAEAVAPLPAAGAKAARQGALRGCSGEGGGPACRLSPHYARLRALCSLTLEFDFCFVAALAPQLERLRRLQRLEVRAGVSDGRREVLRRLTRSTARLPLRHGVRFRADLTDS